MLTTYAMETQIKPGRIMNTGSEFSLNGLARGTETLRKITYVRKLVETLDQNCEWSSDRSKKS